MIEPSYCQRMARYNRWQNNSLITAADQLSFEDRIKDRGLFFKSIDATFHHILWADRIWMSRLGGWEKPQGPNNFTSSSVADWEFYKSERQAADTQLIDWADRQTKKELYEDLTWFSGSLQRDMSTPRWICVVQVFNHQTHHRGQIHACLTAAGLKPEDTDLPFMPDAWL